MAAYDAAADWGEAKAPEQGSCASNRSAKPTAKAMDGAYAAMSWDDAAVKAGLPRFCCRLQTQEHESVDDDEFQLGIIALSSNG